MCIEILCKFANMNKCAHIVLILLSIILLCSCDGYSRLVKSEDYATQYSEAKRYYDEERYSRARQLLENLQLHYRDRENAENILWYYSQCLLKQKDYYLAAYNFTMFTKRYPYSTRAEEALYLAAYCKYKEAPPSYLDQTITKDAIEEFERFAERYPSSIHIPEVNAYLDEMNKRLMQKDYDIAVGYYNIESYHAAYVALKNFLNLYPDSPNREDAMYYILRSGYEYASNSREDKMQERLQQVVGDFDKFATTFTNSKYKESAQEIYTKSKALLAKIEQEQSGESAKK